MVTHTPPHVTVAPLENRAQVKWRGARELHGSKAILYLPIPDPCSPVELKETTREQDSEELLIEAHCPRY